MKPFLFSILIILISCSEPGTTPQQKAEKSIKDHLSAKFGSNNGYEPVETKLDSFYATYALTKEGASLQKEYNTIHAQNKDIYSPNALMLTNREMVLMDTLTARDQRFGKVFYGWKAVHAYKAKNPQGVSSLATDTFLLNRDYQLMQADTISL